MTLMSIDLDDVIFTKHALRRFRSRFPGRKIAEVFSRAVPASTRCIWRLCPEAGCDKPLLDAESGAIFICNRDKGNKEQFVCITVIRPNRGG